MIITIMMIPTVIKIRIIQMIFNGSVMPQRSESVIFVRLFENLPAKLSEIIPIVIFR